MCNSSNSTPVYSCWERREAARWTAGTEANNDVVGAPAEEAADLDQWVDVVGEATVKEVLDRQNVSDTNEIPAAEAVTAKDDFACELCRLIFKNIRGLRLVVFIKTILVPYFPVRWP